MQLPAIFRVVSVERLFGVIERVKLESLQIANAAPAEFLLAAGHGYQEGKHYVLQLVEAAVEDVEHALEVLNGTNTAEGSETNEDGEPLATPVAQGMATLGEGAVPVKAVAETQAEAVSAAHTDAPVVERRAEDQQAAVEAAFVDGTLPEADRRVDGTV